MTSQLGLAYDVMVAVFDDDGATFVENKKGIIYKNPNQSWPEAVREKSEFYDKLHELQIGENI